MPWNKTNQLTQLSPKAPSALIRGNRYLLLFSGMLYGYYRHQYLAKHEVKLVEERNDLFEYIEFKKDEYMKKKAWSDEKEVWQMVFSDIPLPDSHINYYDGKDDGFIVKYT